MNRIQKAGQGIDSKIISNAGRYGVALKVRLQKYRMYIHELLPDGVELTPDPRYTEEKQKIFIHLDGSVTKLD